MKRVMRFDKKQKPSPRYVGPYQILKRFGKVTYELELLANLVAVHPVFHISLLKKCMSDPTSVIPLESVVVKDRLSYEDVLVQFLDRQVRRLRNNFSQGFVEELVHRGSYLGSRCSHERQISSSFFPIPLQLDVIVPLQFFSHSCVNSVLESCSLSLYLYFHLICIFSELN